MSRYTDARILGVAALAVVLMTTGAPAVACAALPGCAAMPGCPISAAPPGCHDAVGPAASGHCAPPSRLATHSCCTAPAPTPAAIVKAAQRPAAPEVPAISALSAGPVHLAAAPAPPPAFLDTGPAPSGRDLLSLHRTLLI